MNSTISNWRESRKKYNLIGLKGIIVSLTKINNSENNSSPFFVALAKIENKTNLILPLVSESEDPKIKDKVILVLRRTKTPTKSEIIEYSLKLKKIN